MGTRQLQGGISTTRVIVRLDTQMMTTNIPRRERVLLDLTLLWMTSSC